LPVALLGDLLLRHQFLIGRVFLGAADVQAPVLVRIRERVRDVCVLAVETSKRERTLRSRPASSACLAMRRASDCCHPSGDARWQLL